jgi:hypothetical protein
MLGVERAFVSAVFDGLRGIAAASHSSASPCIRAGFRVIGPPDFVGMGPPDFGVMDPELSKKRIDFRQAATRW